MTRAANGRPGHGQERQREVRMKDGKGRDNGGGKASEGGAGDGVVTAAMATAMGEGSHGEVRAKSRKARATVVRGGSDGSKCKVATEQQQWWAKVVTTWSRAVEGQQHRQQQWREARVKNVHWCVLPGVQVSSCLAGWTDRYG